MGNGHTNPTTTIRKSFVRGQVWNPSQWNDPEYDKRWMPPISSRMNRSVRPC